MNKYLIFVFLLAYSASADSTFIESDTVFTYQSCAICGDCVPKITVVGQCFPDSAKQGSGYMLYWNGGESEKVMREHWGVLQGCFICQRESKQFSLQIFNKEEWHRPIKWGKFVR